MKLRKPGAAGPKDMGTNVMQRGGRARLTTDVQRKLGQQLRAMYDDVVQQGVPDRFSQLLDQIEKAADKDKSE
jgi:hypothetical protein